MEPINFRKGELPGTPREIAAPTHLDRTNNSSRNPYEPRVNSRPTARANWVIWSALRLVVVWARSKTVGRFNSKKFFISVFADWVKKYLLWAGKSSRAITFSRGDSSHPTEFPLKRRTLKWFVQGPWPTFSSTSKSPISVVSPPVEVANLLPSPSIDFLFLFPDSAISHISSSSSVIKNATQAERFNGDSLGNFELSDTFSTPPALFAGVELKYFWPPSFKYPNTWTRIDFSTILSLTKGLPNIFPMDSSLTSNNVFYFTFTLRPKFVFTLDFNIRTITAPNKPLWINRFLRLLLYTLKIGLIIVSSKTSTLQHRHCLCRRRICLRNSDCLSRCTRGRNR